VTSTGKLLTSEESEQLPGDSKLYELLDVARGGLGGSYSLATHT
jgi:hypothetical protein